MGAAGTGFATPESSKGRERLSLRDPRLNALLGGLELDEESIPETRLFGNALLRQRDAWADRNRSGRRYSDREAYQHKRNALARRDGGK